MPDTRLQIIQKGQDVRLLDVFAIGPVMILAGEYVHQRAETNLETALSASLYAIGVGTIFFNGRNYLRQKAVLEKEGL